MCGPHLIEHRALQLDDDRAFRKPVGRYGPEVTQPHGTDAAYRRHQRQGERPCEPCRAAHLRARQDRRRRRVLLPCGTRSAAERHRQNGEPLCPACVEAERAYYRDAARRARERRAS